MYLAYYYSKEVIVDSNNIHYSYSQTSQYLFKSKWFQIVDSKNIHNNYSQTSQYLFKSKWSFKLWQQQYVYIIFNNYTTVIVISIHTEHLFFSITCIQLLSVWQITIIIMLLTHKDVNGNMYIFFYKSTNFYIVYIYVIQSKLYVLRRI